jgi:hypothetical protein
MSLLDLLGAVVNPTLSASERAQVRSMLHQQQRRADAPWQSGIIDRPTAAKSPEEILRERVEDLELTVKVLCDLLVERGALDANALPARVAEIQRQLAAEEEAKDDAQKARAAAARAAAEARTVVCAGCGATVRERASFLSAHGPLCTSCHHTREG